MSATTRYRYEGVEMPPQSPAGKVGVNYPGPSYTAGEVRPHITIINDMPLSFNPRSVKEADALEEHGYSVRVVSVGKSERLMATTEQLIAERRWDYQAVDYHRGSFIGFLRWALSGTAQKTFVSLSRYWLGFGFAERALCRYQRAFLKAALSAPTDMYIAHNLTSLPIAAAAAKIQGVPLGFDVEDYHFDEDSPSPGAQFRRSLKSYLMHKYLPRCAYLSATSNLMADAIAEGLEGMRPAVIYNVFPLSHATGLTPPARRTPSGGYEPLTAYWFSHVIGLDRGLQDFIQAMPRINRRVDLYLRGQVGEETKEKLLALADVAGVREQIFFLPVIDAGDLVRDAARFDFGLALEQPVNKNRQITITNKLFTYLLAGVIPVATATPGQCEVMHQLEGDRVLYSPGAVDDLVSQMNQLVTDPRRMTAAKQAAWDAARSRFCWDVEKRKLLAAVESIARPTRGRHA